MGKGGREGRVERGRGGREGGGVGRGGVEGEEEFGRRLFNDILHEKTKVTVNYVPKHF